jgi:serine/threonine protein kinase
MVLLLLGSGLHLSAHWESTYVSNGFKRQNNLDPGGNHAQASAAMASSAAASPTDGAIAAALTTMSSAKAPRAPLSVSTSSEQLSQPRSQGVKRKRGARDVGAYKILGPVGEGAYGVVWKASDKETNESVALKMIKTGEAGGPDAEYGFPMTSVREIRILKSLRHPNIVNLIEVVTDMEGKMEGGKQGGVYMVFEYLEADLEGLLRTPDVRLLPQHIKSFTHQLLQGLQYMHKQKVNSEQQLCCCCFRAA